ncbi:MAG: acetyltransferase [Gracilimonas sp.]|uniref:acetyltransferase n=1 Tax=Gracilimonas sp. TaxID=1974203 RepID=UPI003751B193|nr:acetyltransferase [Gracilimonas sp.]
MESNSEQLKIAEQIRNACIKAAKEGFLDASMSGLCREGAMEAAISAIESLDVEQLVEKQKSKRDA